MKVTREDILQCMQGRSYRPLGVEELRRHFGLTRREIANFLQLLKEMEGEGEIIRIKGDRFTLPERLNLVVGRLEGNPQGYGFVIPDKRGEGDIFISPGKMGGAMHGDRVMVRVEGITRARKREGAIVRILKRAQETIVGTYEGRRRYGFVVPDDQHIFQDIYVAREDAKGAKSGQKVVVRIVEFPTEHRNPEGEIIEILGFKDEPGIDILALMREYKLPLDFPSKVWRMAEEAPQEVEEVDLAGRLDLRNLITVTIDGEDAKDFDDAVSIEPLPHGHLKLGVHIADVGHYVKEGSALDKEAYLRGTSIYLVDRAIPMLPPQLSNGICSLNEGVDRLTMTLFMEYDSKGRLVNYEIHDAVIMVRHRLTYNIVKKILVDKDPYLRHEYSDVIKDLELMEELCLKLHGQRMRKGSLDFNIPETKVILDKWGKPIDVIKVERNVAHRIIEEFMIAANVVIATHMNWLKVPFIYRVHEEPDIEKLRDFNEFIQKFGYSLNSFREIKPGPLQKLLDKVAGNPEEGLINILLLRSMKQARYSAENIGHFGLSLDCYTHFTSPIRRYPDLVVHRLVREVRKAGAISPSREHKLEKILPEIASYSSERERIAQEAEEESVNLKKVEFMEDKVGESFLGIISGVHPYGLFVEIVDYFVDGLVPITNFPDDSYYFDEKQYTLRGRYRGQVYRLGDKVEVTVAKVDRERRQIELWLRD